MGVTLPDKEKKSIKDIWDEEWQLVRRKSVAISRDEDKGTAPTTPYPEAAFVRRGGRWQEMNTPSGGWDTSQWVSSSEIRPRHHDGWEAKAGC